MLDNGNKFIFYINFYLTALLNLFTNPNDLYIFKNFSLCKTMLSVSDNFIFFLFNPLCLFCSNILQRS